MQPIEVGEIVIPPEAQALETARASGPGGQRVNKVSTKVILRVDLDAIVGLEPAARERLRRIVRSRLDRQGRLVVRSQKTRTQSRNLEDARQKVRGWILRALSPPRKRVPTQPTRASRSRRLQGKQRRSRLKQQRRAPDPTED